MFIETRKQGKKQKYYLVHSYRVGDKVQRITRYLGSDLNPKELGRLRVAAERRIREEIKERNILEFELSERELELFREQDARIDIDHLQEVDWERFTKKFTYNTNAIEGSAVKQSEVSSLLDHEKTPRTADEQEAVNVSRAVDLIRKAREPLSVGLIKKLHKICFDKTKPFAGRLRRVEVVVRDARGRVVHQGAPAKEVNHRLRELTSWYDAHKKRYPPLLLAATVHNQFENIHPFEDGNGRVGRLLLNYVLLRHKYPPVNILLADRARYYRTLSTFSDSGDMRPTMRFLISQYRKQYK